MQIFQWEKEASNLPFYRKDSMHFEAHSISLLMMHSLSKLVKKWLRYSMVKRTGNSLSTARDWHDVFGRPQKNWPCWKLAWEEELTLRMVKINYSQVYYLLRLITYPHTHTDNLSSWDQYLCDCMITSGYSYQPLVLSRWMSSFFCLIKYWCPDGNHVLGID